MNNQLKLMVDVPMWYETKGISKIRIDGPHIAEQGAHRQAIVFKLSAWITKYPNADEPPDFYAEMDHASLINLRNALSAALFATEQR